MDEQRLLHACELVSEANYEQAYAEFIQLAENTPDPIERAWPLLYAADTLQTMGKQEAATAQLAAARALIEEHRSSASMKDEKFIAAETFLDFQDANLSWLQGHKLEVALNKFEAALRKHRLALKDPRAASLYHAFQIRRSFILADLGRWKEALPVLEAIKSPQEYREGVAFYLGHCYLAASDYIRAEQKLTEALRLGGLPNSLDYRAHHELGMTYYHLRDYGKAKAEFEKGAQLADASYIKESQIWRWLELTCRALGLKAEAQQYARRSKPS